jgi:hypothetical protein
MHKVPLFLEEEDRFLFGLTMRQLLVLLIGATTSSLLFARSLDWIAHPLLALWVGLLLAALAGLFTVLVAFTRVGGRGLEEWGLVALLFLCQPPRYLWHFDAPDRFEQRNASLPPEEQL